MSDEKQHGKTPETKSGDQIDPRWTPEMLARRRSRAKVMAWVLVALISLFFIVTVVKLGGNIAERAI